MSKKIKGLERIHIYTDKINAIAILDDNKKIAVSFEYNRTGNSELTTFVNSFSNGLKELIEKEVF